VYINVNQWTHTQLDANLDVYKSGLILGRKHITINLSGLSVFVVKIRTVSKGKFCSITGHEGTVGGGGE
jgi:hypothetical protein